jgi:hypothetical protein
MILYCVGTVELANDGADCVEKMAGLSNSSNAPSMGNCEPEDNVSSLRELCVPSSVDCLICPSSAPQNAARHIKWAFHTFRKEASDFINDSATSDVASEAAVSVPYMIQDRAGENGKMVSTAPNDKDLTRSGIDPFWPFCMFELRGKCNDEECQWQHVENHAWRKPKHTNHAVPCVSGCFMCNHYILLILNLKYMYMPFITLCLVKRFVINTWIKYMQAGVLMICFSIFCLYQHIVLVPILFELI